MLSMTKEWNPKQVLLKKFLEQPVHFREAIKICLEMHSLVHTSDVSGSNFSTYEDELWDGLTTEMLTATLPKKNTTIAWDLWHITRIEDITANILVANSRQILNASWLKKLKIEITDTGNAMTDKEINDFSLSIDLDELRNYRIAVGRKTQNIIRQLIPGDLKRKMTSAQLQKIFDEGGVVEDTESKWLLTFWGKKTVAGILLMPITRHQIVHLNECMKIKEKYLKSAS